MQTKEIWGNMMIFDRLGVCSNRDDKFLKNQKKLMQKFILEKRKVDCLFQKKLQKLTKIKIFLIWWYWANDSVLPNSNQISLNMIIFWRRNGLQKDLFNRIWDTLFYWNTT